MSKRILVVMMAVGVCAVLAQAGIRADLSGDAVVDFQTTMDMPFVTVGNPGNAADTEIMTTDGTTGYGAVDYTYRMGKFEVTAGQYCEFLNKGAAWTRTTCTIRACGQTSTAARSSAMLGAALSATRTSTAWLPTGPIGR